MALSLRKWATPLIVGSFLLMAVSGILMFFHIELGLLDPIHEWAGWVLLVAAVAHVVLNWRAFTTYLKRPLAKAIMGGCAVLLVAAMLVPVSDQQNKGPGALISTMSSVSMDKLALVADKSLSELQADLGQAGYDGTAATDTAQSLAGDNRGAQMTILNAALK